MTFAPIAAAVAVAGIFAIEDIYGVGTELTYDYHCSTFGTMKDAKCYCGSQHCRVTMGGKADPKVAAATAALTGKGSKKGKGKKK